MKKVKVLHCLVFYLPCRIGGIEVYVHSLNLHLLKKGYDVKVVVPIYPGEKPYEQVYEGVPIITYTGILNETKAEFEGDAPGSNLDEFRTILKTEQPNIVHFHQLTSSNGISIFHVRAARELGITIFFTNHLAGFTCSTGKMVYREKNICDGLMKNIKCAVCDLQKFQVNEMVAQGMVRIGAGISPFLPDRPESKMLQLLTYSKRIARKRKRVLELMDLVDCFIVLTDWYYKVLQANRLNMGKVKIIKQGLPFVNEPLKATPHNNSNRLRLVFVGRIFPEKGLLILLKALERIDDSLYSLDIYGQIDDKLYNKACESLIGNRSNVKYQGHIKSKEIVNVLREYDVLVLPSMIAEMAPLVIREAFAAGIPVVGSASGGIQEAIRNGEDGLLFDMGNDQQLQEIIEKLINNKDLLKSLTKQVIPPTPFEEIADQVENEYVRLLQPFVRG